jgi:hypothetical protein
MVQYSVVIATSREVAVNAVGLKLFCTLPYSEIGEDQGRLITVTVINAA